MFIVFYSYNLYTLFLERKKLRQKYMQKPVMDYWKQKHKGMKETKNW
jgi:hypothetical protein